MLFKNKEKVPQENDVSPPAPMDAEPKAKDQDLRLVHSDHVYPSGLKLALLMTSIFVGMFLVALVRSSSRLLQECVYVRAS